MESNSSGVVSQEKHPSFEDLSKKVANYLSDPRSGDPTRDVNEYFRGIKDPKEIVTKTHDFLFDTRSKLLRPQESDFIPEYGTVGTITMNLPYFYPLHITLFSWYVDASLGNAQKLSDEDKQALVKKLREDADVYHLIPSETKRVENSLNRFYDSSKDKTPILPPKELSSPWHKKLNPFKGKK